MTPEWYLLLAGLAFTTSLGFVWHSCFLAGPLLLVVVTFETSLAAVHAWQTRLSPHRSSLIQRIRMRLCIAFLYRLQPLARAAGRWNRGLTPWRSRGLNGFILPLPTQFEVLHAKWKLPQDWLHLAENQLLCANVIAIRGGDFDRWDLEIRAGLFASVRVSLITEDVGDEKQRVRWRMMPHATRWAVMFTLIPVVIATVAAAEGQQRVALVISGVAIYVVGRIIRNCGAAMATLKRASLLRAGVLL